MLITLHATNNEKKSKNHDLFYITRAYTIVHCLPYFDLLTRSYKSISFFTYFFGFRGWFFISCYHEQYAITMTWNQKFWYWAIGDVVVGGLISTVHCKTSLFSRPCIVATLTPAPMVSDGQECIHFCGGMARDVRIIAFYFTWMHCTCQVGGELPE